ncbi:MAG: L-seryl-tRNA(Sec) selenium transferase [Raoultibacter sp.]
MHNDINADLLRQLPQIEEVLKHEQMQTLCATQGRPCVLECLRSEIDALRHSILAGNKPVIAIDDIMARTARAAHALEAPSLRPVINATGIIIHTNLGRSALAPRAVQAVEEVARGYSTLEYNTTLRQRGSRHDHCERLICTLTGAEAAMAVNNNAAAVMMVLSEFACDKRALVSRGELVEIGGSFRIPDIMELSHARMVEVGTTNKTHLADYERAITCDTTMMLKVHPSNYRICGFTESVALADLRALADTINAQRAADDTNPSTEEILIYEDQGSGSLITLECLKEQAEPTVAQSLQAGCDLVSFSGDKLLGGPQAGIIVGSKKLIDRLKKNPLARAVRLDKMTLAALEATLKLYLDPERALQEIPTLHMLSAPLSEMHTRAETLKRILERQLPSGCAAISIVEEIARAGGGALPLCDIPTAAVRIAPTRGTTSDCERYFVSQRRTPIICRIKHDALLCDVRTLQSEEEMEEIARAFCEYFTIQESD